VTEVRRRPRHDAHRSLLGAALAVVLVAGVGAGCASSPGGGRSTGPSPSLATGEPPPLTGGSDPSSVPAPLWRLGGSGSDLLSGFRDTPYNNDGAPAPTVVDSPNVPGRRAIAFTMPGGGTRTELEPQVPFIGEGDEAWYGFAWYLPPDFPVDTTGWQVLAQWKNLGDGSPPVEVKVGNGQFVLDGGAGGSHPRQTYFTQPIGTARPGEQTDIVVHIKFSADPSQAVVDVWQNGQQRIANYRPTGGTRYDGDNSYLKTGIYRDSAISEPATLFLNDARIASTYDSAAALAGPAPTGR
jgi:Polysaccharide lyase